MAARLGVERRDPDEPVHTLLSREEAVRVLAPGDERGRLDACLLTLTGLDHLDLEAAVLGVPEQHSQQHLRPVLRVGSAGARVDGDDGVAGVIATGEEALELEVAQPFADARVLVTQLVGHGLVLGGHLLEGLEIADVRLELAIAVELALRPRMLR
jgi:hypothetical protein